MRRVRMILLTAVMTLSASCTFAASLGHFCWELAPFQDLINLEVTQPTPGVGFFLLETQWESPQGYHLAGSGIATLNTQANDRDPPDSRLIINQRPSLTATRSASSQVCSTWLRWRAHGSWIV